MKPLQMFGGERWKNNVFATAMTYTSVVFAIVALLNTVRSQSCVMQCHVAQVLWAHGSSAAIPFGTLLALIVLWFGLSIPLVCVAHTPQCCDMAAELLRRVLRLQGCGD